MADEQDTVSCGELAKLLDVAPATIRTWEARYGWPPALRTLGGHRRYKRADLPLLRRVAELRSQMPTREAILLIRQGVG